MILDTCAVLWLAAGDARLSQRARSQIQSAATVYVCAITGFEIATKVRRGKLFLPAPPAEWFESIVEHHGITELPLDLATCVQAAGLPGHHGDPCDRLIIASALRLGISVVTVDPMFAAYGVEVTS